MPGGETPTSLDYRGNVVQPTANQISGSATGPAGGATIATMTLVPGTYVLSWEVGLAGTSVAGDANNFGLNVGGSQLLVSENPGATLGVWPQNAIQVTVLTLPTTTVAVKAIGAGGGSATYSAEVSATPVTAVSPDDPLAPYNPLTVNGLSVSVTSTPANLAVTMAGFDLGAQAECQLGRGLNVPSGTTDYGFVDTTYLPTQAQQLTGMQAGQF